jgi:hypothetical protein
MGIELLRSFQSFRVSAGVSPAAAYDQAWLFASAMGVVALVCAFFVQRLRWEEESAPAKSRSAA